MRRNLAVARRGLPFVAFLMMGLMLAAAMRMGARDRISFRILESDVSEPLDRAQALKDRITLLHTGMFELLSIGNDEGNPAIRKAGADALIALLDDEVASFNRFIDHDAALPRPLAVRLRQAFGDYTSRLRETVRFAADDIRYAALLAGPTNDHFGHLRAEFDSLAQSLAGRRQAVATEAVSASLAAQRQMLRLGLGAAIVILTGSIVVRRERVDPVVRLTASTQPLAKGHTDLVIPGTDRGDQVGAMAKVIEVSGASLVARGNNDATPRQGSFQMRPGLFVQAANEPMADGGCVHALENVTEQHHSEAGITDTWPPPDSDAVMNGRRSSPQRAV